MVDEINIKCVNCGLENVVEVRGCFGEPIIHGEDHFFCLECKKVTKIIKKHDS